MEEIAHGFLHYLHRKIVTLWYIVFMPKRRVVFMVVPYGLHFMPRDVSTSLVSNSTNFPQILEMPEQKVTIALTRVGTPTECGTCAQTKCGICSFPRLDISFYYLNIWE